MVFNDGARSTLDSEDASHFQDHIFRRSPAWELASQFYTNNLSNINEGKKITGITSCQKGNSIYIVLLWGIFLSHLYTQCLKINAPYTSCISLLASKLQIPSAPTFGHLSSQGIPAMTSTASAPPTPMQIPPRPPPLGVCESVPISITPG